MDNQQFDKIWTEVQNETTNRKKGSFKRALWYGNNSAVFGQNKGVRKQIRNAPRKVVKKALGVPLAAVPPGLSDLISAAMDVALTKGKDIYSANVKPHIKSKRPMSAEEALRKNIKSSVKDLKGNAFQAIDRNLVKLRDAKKKVGPAIQDMMQAQSQPGASPSGQSSEAELKKAHGALRAVAETQYYVDKITTLIVALQTANERLVTDLSALKVSLEKTQDDVTGYVKEHL